MHNMSSNYSFLSGAYHLAYYFPRTHGNPDTVSDYILNFKGNEEPNTSKWIALATREIKNKINNIDLIVRVLSSAELTATGGTALDKLGATIAKFTNSNYDNSALKKTRQTQSLKYLSRAERQREINGAYIFNKPSSIRSNSPRILLIDDIVTSGTTIREVNRAIKAALPNCSLYFFTIGKTHRASDVNNGKILGEFRKSAKEIFHNLSLTGSTQVQTPINIRTTSPPGPNLVKTSDGKWKPADGYDWKNVNDPTDFTVVKITSALTRQGEKWTIPEEEMLVKLVAKGNLRISDISRKLKRTSGGIKAKIGRLAYGSKTAVGSVYVHKEIINQWQRKLNGETTSLIVKRKSSPSYTSSSSSNSSDGCFIATAVYQNANHPFVNDFRLFRDTYMVGNNFGENFIRNYYKYSPNFARKLNRIKILRKIVLVSFIKPIHLIITRFQLKGNKHVE